MSVKLETTADAVLPSRAEEPNRNVLKAVIESMKSFFKPDIMASLLNAKGSGMQFLRTKDGGLRWFAVVSNNFKDREREIIPEAAHREYVSWADHSLNYPELWLWHAGAKSKWGTTDWLDVSDGFLVASGLVDRGKESIAYNLV